MKELHEESTCPNSGGRIGISMGGAQEGFETGRRSNILCNLLHFEFHWPCTTDVILSYHPTRFPRVGEYFAKMGNVENLPCQWAGIYIELNFDSIPCLPDTQAETVYLLISNI